MMLKAADEAADKNWDVTEAECWHFTGLFYYNDNNFMKAFEYMQKAQTAFEEYAVEPKYSYLHHYSNVLANCYYHFGEYREAIRYLKKSLQLAPYWNNVSFPPRLQNTIALGICLGR